MPSLHLAPTVAPPPLCAPPRLAARAGIVTILGLIVTVAYWFVTGPPGGWSAESKLKWSPFTHLQFWCARPPPARRRRCHEPRHEPRAPRPRRFAMLGGGMAFMHYFFLLKAFEGAPSTVLLPLVQAHRSLPAAAPERRARAAAGPTGRPAPPPQVASVSVLVGSSLLAIMRKEQWITPVHALAYLLMFIGGARRTTLPSRAALPPRCPHRPARPVAQASCRRAAGTCRCCCSAASGSSRSSCSRSPPSSRSASTT